MRHGARSHRTLSVLQLPSDKVGLCALLRIVAKKGLRCIWSIEPYK